MVHRISFPLLLILFLTPAYQLFRPIQNYYFIFFFVFLAAPIALFGKCSNTRIPFLLLSIYPILCFSCNPSPSGLINIALAIFLIGISFVDKFSISMDQLARVLVITSYANAVLCIAQIFNPSVSLSNINPNYILSGYSSVSSLFPFLPSLGRLRGLFVENSALCQHLLVYSIFFIAYLRISLRNVLSATSSSFLSFVRFPFSLSSQCFYALLLNLSLITFTGSKGILFSFPIVIVSLFYPLGPVLKHPLGLEHLAFKFKQRVIINKKFLISAIILFVLIALLIAASIQLVFLLSNYFPNLYNLQSVGARASFNGSIDPFTLTGLLPSGSGEAGSLNGFIIYSSSFGYVIAIIMLSMIALDFLRSPILGISLLFAFIYFMISGGSLMNTIFIQSYVIMLSFKDSLLLPYHRK